MSELKGKVKKTDQLGTSASKKWHYEFPEFSFCFIHLIHGVEEANIPEMPTYADKKR